MDDTRDQSLQEWLESNPNASFPEASPDEQADRLAYQALFSQLRTTPDVGLPYGFARRLRQQVEQKAYRRSDIRFQLFGIGLFVVAVLVGYGLLFLVDAESARQTRLVVIQHIGSLLVGVGLFIGIQLINPQWMRHQVNTWSR